MTPTFRHFLTDILRIRHLSRAQLVYVAIVFDRVDPADLPDDDREIARTLFGDVDRILEAARHVAATLKGARVGGTWLHSLFLLFQSLTAPLAGLAPGEQAFAIIVAPDLRLARQALRYASGAASETASIAGCVVTSGSDSLVIRRPQDGRLVAIECLPATRGGSAVRGRTLVAALLDEACFFRDESSVVNASEIYRAVAPRILPGGLLSIISTVWAEGDFLHERVTANHGNPTTALACIAPTLVMREDARIQQIVAEERERDPENAAREFDCIPFASGSGLFFDSAALSAACDDALPLVVPRPEGCSAGVGCDTGLVSDSSAAVAVHRAWDAGVVTVAETLEMRPTPGAPLKLSEVCAAYADLMKRHDAHTALADGHELVASNEHLTRHGVSLDAAPGGANGKLDTYVHCRSLLNEGKLRIPSAQQRLLRQLREVCSRPMPGGTLRIWSPRRGGHGDLVSALVLATWSVSHSTNPLIEAMRERLRRRAAGEKLPTFNPTW